MQRRGATSSKSSGRSTGRTGGPVSRSAANCAHELIDVGALYPPLHGPTQSIALVGTCLACNLYDMDISILVVWQKRKRTVIIRLNGINSPYFYLFSINSNATCLRLNSSVDPVSPRNTHDQQCLAGFKRNAGIAFRLLLRASRLSVWDKSGLRVNAAR